MKTKLLLLFLPLVLLLSSCMTTKRLNYLQTGSGIPQYADSIEYEDYRLQKGDYLYIRIYSPNPEDLATYNGTTGSSNQYQQLSQAGDNANARLLLYLVAEDGTINYPYVGKLQVLNKTTREVKFLLEDVLRESISAFSADVKLSNRSFSVLGESGSGRYSIPKEKLTIFQALAMSGDMSLYAKRSKIQIIRQTEHGTVVKTFDLRSQSIINSEYYYIQPNDVIYVPFDNAKFFGVSHVTGALSLVISTLSFGLLIYGLVIQFSKP